MYSELRGSLVTNASPYFTWNREWIAWPKLEERVVLGERTGVRFSVQCRTHCIMCDFSVRNWNLVFLFGVPWKFIRSIKPTDKKPCFIYYQPLWPLAWHKNENCPWIIQHLAIPSCDLPSSVQIINVGNKVTMEKVKSETVKTQPCHTAAGAAQGHEAYPKCHLHQSSLRTKAQDYHKHQNKDNQRTFVITGSDRGYPKIHFQWSISLYWVISNTTLMKK